MYHEQIIEQGTWPNGTTWQLVVQTHPYLKAEPILVTYMMNASGKKGRTAINVNSHNRKGYAQSKRFIRDMAKVYGTSRDPQGLAARLHVRPSDVDPAALARGTRAEMREHGVGRRTARRIALDHLAENPRAYAVKRKLRKGGRHG